MHTFVTPLSLFKEELYYYHVKVPRDVHQYFKDRGIDRVICTINDEIRMHSGFLSEGNGRYYILINKDKKKKLEVEEGDDLHVKLEEDTSKYGMEMPIEFEEALASDIDGEAHFHKLTPGKQRSLIFLVAKVKNQDKRIEKAIIILRHLVANQGKLDYKMLNIAFKQGLI